jgi:hypothetical protein
MTDRFCLECQISGEPIDLGKGKVHQERNWECPLLGGAKICETCCQVELAGGMGAPDTLRETSRKTGKSASEIHSICVACPHGGPELEEPPRLLSARGNDGKLHESGPEFDSHDRKFRESWDAQLAGLKADTSLPPREAR